MFDHWLLDEIYGLPDELQYGAYAAMDSRSRFDSYRFHCEVAQLRQSLDEAHQATVRAGLMAQWIGEVYPSLQPDIVRLFVGGQQACEQGFRNAAKNGVSMSRFL